jgi:protein-tyrosine phosphatase
MSKGKKNERWLARRYGSRRGYIRTVWHKILYQLGFYDAYKKVDWTSVDRIVFICKGNICRSAFAEEVGRSLGIDAISCGLDTIGGASADFNAIVAAEKLGFNLNDHVSKPIMHLVFKKTDLLVATEPWHIEYVRKYLTREHACTLLGLWGNPVLPHISDPYGTSPEYFNKCFKFIQQAVDSIDNKINKKSDH